MQLKVIGCGDAFGSGGRLQTCFHVASEGKNFLIDCGVTALIGLGRQGIDPNEVSAIFISHLHGDHYGGLVWWMLHAEHVANRTAPLTVVGPKGLEERFSRTADLLFPGALAKGCRFDLDWQTYSSDALVVDGVKTSVVEVSHPCGAPPYAMRLEVDGKTVSFSGDTEWVDGLLDIGRGSDLFISECFSYASNVRYHMSWRTIEGKLSLIDARKILLTHMGPEMLAHRSEVASDRVLVAEDGMVIDI